MKYKLENWLSEKQSNIYQKSSYVQIRKQLRTNKKSSEVIKIRKVHQSQKILIWNFSACPFFFFFFFFFFLIQFNVIFKICLFDLILNVPVNNFSVMLGRRPYSWVLPVLLGSKLSLAQGNKHTDPAEDRTRVSRSGVRRSNH